MKRLIYILSIIIAAVSCVKGPEPVEEPVSEGRVTLEVTSESRMLEMDKDGLTGEILFKSKGGGQLFLMS